MIHVTHTHGLCHAYEGLMSNIQMGHFTLTNRSCYLSEWGTWLMLMNHIKHTNEIMSLIRMSESCHSYEQVRSLIPIRNITHTNTHTHTHTHTYTHAHTYTHTHTHAHTHTHTHPHTHTHTHIHTHTNMHKPLTPRRNVMRMPESFQIFAWVMPHILMYLSTSITH